MATVANNTEQRIRELQNTIDEQQALIAEMESDSKRDERALMAARTQIMRADRLQLAGTVSAQLAHDFRNILAPILMLPPVIRRSLDSDDPCAAYLDEIEQAAEDMVKMTEDLAVLSTRGQFDAELVNTNDIVKELTLLLDRTAEMNDVKISSSLDKDILPIKGARAQLSRAFQNLMENSMDSMPDGGVMSISTENVYLDKPLHQYDSVHAGEYVLVRVADVGCGIPEQVRGRIYAPFFTTKKTEKHRSSGLGLSIVSTVVRDHCGYIDLISSKEDGTTFSLYFPTCRDLPRQAAFGDVIGGTESILVVDDDELQVELMSLLLSTLGYSVKGATSGPAAVSMLQEHGVDLVVMDMVMPDMNGAETLRAIRCTHADQKAIVASGFDDCPGRDDAIAMGITTFIKKPITLEGIGRAVRQELDE